MKDLPLMSTNASGGFKFEKYLEVPEGNVEAKLFQIIDDIDTALDMFKPEMRGFEKYVCSKIDEAKSHIISDGYKLYYRKYKKE